MNEFTTKLNEIAAPEQSIARRIAELEPEIRAAMERGFSRASVVKALAAMGVVITPETLSLYLSRIKRKAKRKSATPVQPPPTPVPAVQPLAQDQPSTSASQLPMRKEVPASDPRFIKDILSNPPDLEQMAKDGLKGMTK